MKIVVFGLTITSSWGNGHATTYRALIKALAERGHTIVFLEKDVAWYRSNRDCPDPSSCSVRLYEDWQTESPRLLAETTDADIAVIGSYFPDAIAAAEALFACAAPPILFYDIDTPITLAALRQRGANEYMQASLIPHFAAYLSFSGGPALQELEQRFHARRALPFFCSVDPALYRQVSVRPEFACDLSYLGTYASDRQPSLTALLSEPAALLPDMTFRVAGAQYPAEIAWPNNVLRSSHIAPPDHPAFYASSRFSLNLTRADMIAAGYSPSVRLFEASACASAILSDSWPGLDSFLTPGEEILLPRTAEDIASILKEFPDAGRRRMGQRARDRILAEHTSAHRAIQFEQIVSSL